MAVSENIIGWVQERAKHPNMVAWATQNEGKAKTLAAAHELAKAAGLMEQNPK